MGDDPVLTVDSAPAEPRAVALVLHGGRSRSTARVRAGQLAVLRMKPFATSLVRAGTEHGLVVARLRYRVRGWNGSRQSPVPDVAWALDRLSTAHPGLPVGLVGHSMGGRAALYAAGHDAVRSVVALAPWLEPADPSAQLAGRRVLIAHGDGDRMTSAEQSAQYAQHAERVAASMAYVSVRDERHAMLRRAGLWHQLATGFTLAALCDVPPSGTVDAHAANVLVEALSGGTALVV